MKRSRRLEPVVKVAQSQEKEEATALGDAQSVLTQAEKRLDELKGYREEYIRQFHEAGSVGMGAARMEDYQKFLHNLSLAIDQQVVVLAQAEHSLEEQRQRWYASRGKAQMLDNIVSRYQDDERREIDHREQGEQDERSQHVAKKNS